MFKMASNVSIPNYLSESEEDLETMKQTSMTMPKKNFAFFVQQKNF